MGVAGATYEFEIIGSDGSIRCWHQLASATVGSAASGARLQVGAVISNDSRLQRVDSVTEINL